MLANLKDIFNLIYTWCYVWACQGY